MKKKRRNNKKNIIISSVFVLILILIIISIISYAKKNKKEENHGDWEVMGIYDESQDNIPSLKYANIDSLALFSKETNQQILIAKKFERIFEERIPTLYNDISDLKELELSEYYEENEDSIKTSLYDIDEDNYIKLCKKLQSMKSDISRDFQICDFNRQEDFVRITCTYEDNEKIVLDLSKDKILTFVE